MALVPKDVGQQEVFVVAIEKPGSLGSRTLKAWFEAKIAENEAPGEKLLSASEVVEDRKEGKSSCTQVRVSQTSSGMQIRTFFAIGDGKKAALSIAIASSEKVFHKYLEPTRAFFASMRFVEALEPEGKSEKVPATSFSNGKPQGIWLGRSLLTGRAACLLFLADGRATRFIPEQGLERFDWDKHKSGHAGDCGIWTMEGSTLTIKWGDGGTHKGELKGGTDSIEFYGKRYSKPRSASISELAGVWESARGIAGVLASTTLRVDSSGAFTWNEVVGASIPEAVSASSNILKGKIEIRGLTAVLMFEDGSVKHYTFLPAQGSPLTAFSLGSKLFVRP